jgi:hypothetical protein
MLQTVIGPKSCRVCQKEFIPFQSMQIVCGVACARKVPVIQRKEARADRVKTRQKLEAMRPLSYWIKQAQTAFNAWVRARDIKAGHGCIDCGKPFEPDKLGGSVDAGHYLSRGSAPHLKFDERNVFAQRKNCNRPGGATRADFRAGVIARIGLAAVEALESDQTVKQYRADDLRAIRDEYRARLRVLHKTD